MRFTHALVITSLCASIGCVDDAFVIESKTTPGYTRTLDRLIIIFKSGDKDAINYFKTIEPQLSKTLTSLHISNISHIYNPIGLDEDKEIKSKTDQFQPHHTLYITMTAKGRYKDNPGRFGRFNLQINEFGSDTIIWRAVATSLMDTVYIDYKAPAGVVFPDSPDQRITKCLQKDGLIRMPQVTPKKG